MSSDQGKYLVAVVGAGPAGIFAARALSEKGMKVVLFNRDIKPGGLAEYGIYYTKEKMKSGLRNQFRQVLDNPDIAYVGNISVGEQGDISLTDLRKMGFQAILVTVGAQGTKWLGLPGEDLKGVYHAKDLVYHYNKLPPFSQQNYLIGKKVALIGVGNVMIDIAHWIIHDLKVDEVIAVARRGPAEVKFTKKEFEYVAANLDLAALENEIKRVASVMESVGQDVEAAKAFILSGLAKAEEPVSDSRLLFDFLASPSRIIGNETGNVVGLEVEETILVPHNGDTKAKKSGKKHILDVDTVVFCIGDRVDETLGLPVSWNEFAKNPNPQFPINDISYEAYNPETSEAIPGIFLAGWAREASSGLVGTARKDGTQGAQATIAFLETLEPLKEIDLDALYDHLDRLNKPYITKKIWRKLETLEQEEAQKQGLVSFKFDSNEKMLEVLGLTAQPTI